jgi:amidophosphoribosyltransferase
MGLVQDAFSQEQLARLAGADRDRPRPLLHRRRLAPQERAAVRGRLRARLDGVCHNGNLTNADELRAELEARVDLPVVGRHRGARPPRRRSHAHRARGSDRRRARAGEGGLLAPLHERGPDHRRARSDGHPPLCLGILPGGKDAHVVASEPTAFDLIGAEFVRDVEPGEMVIIDSARHPLAAPPREGPVEDVRLRVRLLRAPRLAPRRPSVYEVRKALGERAGATSTRSRPTSSSVPDSGVPAAIGYARAEDPLRDGAHSLALRGRTFIEPQQSIRHFGVRLKLNPVETVLKGKRVVVIDDSIVRGTTSRKIVKMVRDAGAREVHLRISSPPTQWPCYYGIDTPTRRELIASSHSTDEIARYVTADSLGYLSLDGMLRAVSGPNGDPSATATPASRASTRSPFTPLHGQNVQRKTGLSGAAAERQPELQGLPEGQVTHA